MLKIPSFENEALTLFKCTAGLTDYEVRDLNDEINRLMREKRHWENQIVALGGANYRRNVAMLDDDGKEVPGTKGYKRVVRLLAILCLLTPKQDILVVRKTYREFENFSRAERKRKRRKMRPWLITKSL